MFTRAIKTALTEYCRKGTRPLEHELEILHRLGYVDERGRVTASGNAKANELLGRVQRHSDGDSINARYDTDPSSPNYGRARVTRQG